MAQEIVGSNPITHPESGPAICPAFSFSGLAAGLAPVAQWTERRTSNPQAARSNRAGGASGTIWKGDPPNGAGFFLPKWFWPQHVRHNWRSGCVAPEGMTDGHIVAHLAAQTWDDWENPAIIFDYQDRTHFKFVRMRAGDDQWCTGERSDEWLTHLATCATTIEHERYYDVEAPFGDGEVKLLVDGEYVLSYDFGAPFSNDRVGLCWKQGRTKVDSWETMADLRSATQFRLRRNCQATRRVASVGQSVSQFE